MSAEEILKSNEREALEYGDHFSSVSGKKLNIKWDQKRHRAGFGATLMILALVILGVVFFGTTSTIPSDISDRLVAQTDVQYADAVESKKIVIAEALKSGSFPSDTAQQFADEGYLIGYFDENDNFVETNQASQALVIKKDDQIITADKFIETVSSDAKLYAAMNKATYGRAAYYYDDAATEALRDLGISRNNYTDGNKSFEEVMDSALGVGSDTNINTAQKITETAVDENGNETTSTYYKSSGDNTSTRYSSAENILDSVIKKTPGSSETDATLAAADTLKVADTISKEQRSSVFYVTIMENISKMKAGAGGQSRINEAMNYLYRSTTKEVVDVETGELIKVTGAPIESPSLCAILSGSTNFNASEVKNYSSDRILKTTAGNLNLAVAANGKTSNTIFSAIRSTVASVSSRVKSTIGRLLGSGTKLATTTALAPIIPTISSSLIKNSFDSISGIEAGELLVEGAVNVGRKLAVAGSGATAGDAAAVVAYQKVTNDVLAMDAAADRASRSPFDITSQNTFLGSLVHQFSSIIRPSAITTLTSFSNLTNSSISSIITGNTYADSTSTYLTNYGSCDTYSTVGAVGTGHCSEIATFDVSTLNAMDDPEFQKFVEKNTVLKDGVRTIKSGSTLGNFILYNNQRQTPLGTIDGGILSSLERKYSSIPFVANVMSIIESFSDAKEDELRIASGAAFVNTSSNSDWQTYKYAQRYVSLARATAALRQYSNDATAYQNLRYFEGSENPVLAFLESENIVASLP